MIIFDLKCEKGHQFEGWFKDRAAFEEQQSGRLISCPVCSSSTVEMVLSSIAIMGKEPKQPVGADPRELSPMKAMQLLHQYLDRHFDDVGDRFADVALKIHHGEEDKRNIKGTTTTHEENLLREEGIQFFKVPIPKFDS